MQMTTNKPTTFVLPIVMPGWLCVAVDAGASITLLQLAESESECEVAFASAGQTQ